MAHSVQKVVERCEHAQGGEDGDGEGKGHLGKSHQWDKIMMGGESVLKRTEFISPFELRLKSVVVALILCCTRARFVCQKLLVDCYISRG